MREGKLSFYFDLLCLPLVVTLQTAAPLLMGSAKELLWVSLVVSLFLCLSSSFTYLFSLNAVCDCVLCALQTVDQIYPASFHRSTSRTGAAPSPNIFTQLRLHILWIMLYKLFIFLEIERHVCCSDVMFCFVFYIYKTIDVPSAKPCSPTGSTPKPNSFLFRASSRCNVKTSGTHKA